MTLGSAEPGDQRAEHREPGALIGRRWVRDRDATASLAKAEVIGQRKTPARDFRPGVRRTSNWEYAARGTFNQARFKLLTLLLYLQSGPGPAEARFLGLIMTVMP